MNIPLLLSRAERALSCATHRHAVPVDAEELIALLAELQRMAPVVRAAREWHLAKMSPVWLAQAVEEYLEKRRVAGADER